MLCSYFVVIALAWGAEFLAWCDLHGHTKNSENHIIWQQEVRDAPLRESKSNEEVKQDVEEKLEDVQLPDRQWAQVPRKIVTAFAKENAWPRKQPKNY